MITYPILCLCDNLLIIRYILLFIAETLSKIWTLSV